MHAINVFRENLMKFKRFTNTVINPKTLSDLVLKFGHVIAGKVNEEDYIRAHRTSGVNNTIDLKKAASDNNTIIESANYMIQRP